MAVGFGSDRIYDGLIYASVGFVCLIDFCFVFFLFPNDGGDAVVGL